MTADQAEAPATLADLLERAEQERDQARATLEAFESAIGRAGRLWRAPEGQLIVLDSESDLEPDDFLPEGSVELVPAPRAREDLAGAYRRGYREACEVFVDDPDDIGAIDVPDDLGATS